MAEGQGWMLWGIFILPGLPRSNISRRHLFTVTRPGWRRDPSPQDSVHDSHVLTTWDREHLMRHWLWSLVMSSP